MEESFEPIEWPTSPEWLKGRGKRFTTPEEYKAYLKHHLKDFHDDDKELHSLLKKHDHVGWSDLLYKKGYIVPHKLVLTNAGDSMSDTRMENVNEKCRIRRALCRESKRWKYHMGTSKVLRIPKRVIMQANDPSDIYDLVEWLCKSFYACDIYMYDGTGSNTGYKYYANEPVIIFCVDDKPTKNSQLFRRLHQSEVSYEYYGTKQKFSLKDKWIIVFDTTRSVKSRGYVTVDAKDGISFKTQLMKFVKTYAN